MPYASNKQAAFMHIHHPEIAAKWHKEGHGYVKGGKNDPARKKRIKKDRAGWLKPLAVGVAGGAVANQVPSYGEMKAEGRREARREAQRKARAKVKKILVPAHDDPFFNQEAAQKTFDLVMKMDDDTAAVFCHIVASDLLEQEVENNRVTLQKHLDEVIAKRIEMVKRATLRSVSKGGEAVVPYAQALALIEKVSSNEDDDGIPNWEFERKIRRDVSTGRFQAKFHNKPMSKKPIPDKTWTDMGNSGAEEARKKRIGDEGRARFQSQYLQVAEFLNAVNASTGGPGNNQVLLHYKNDDTGETWTEKHGSDKPPVQNLLQNHTRVVGAEALPTTLTHGGAAYSLAGAMGRQMPASQVQGINTAASSSAGWTQAWLEAGNDAHQQANARLYQRTATLGQAAGVLGPPGGKVQLAGQLAEIVGQYGPQAESVLGPSARKTAYRYRGTEKTPDKRLVTAYGRAVEENKKVGPIHRFADKEEAERREPRGTRGRVSGPGPRPAPSLNQMVAEREARAGRAPEWGEREMGRAAVTAYLTEKLPSKKNYKLQLASGNTPPSEGVIINAQGQIVTQAIGYGDDHYLPFNLKNLKGLKGGEYVRNRSVGGLTAEDVYTGLITGARRVTVVSRSGTFTMEFQPDFRGGRRHNDKARRMTRRYEQILDAVQSEQVERQDVPPRWKKIIENEVRGENPGATQRMLRREIDNRTKEFKANPQIDGRDLDRAEASISQMEEREKRGEISRQDVADYRKEIMNELRDLKEIHFRLNGVGYAAALDSLREQFPYYISTDSNPKEEHLTELERDEGYVEPGRNRPTGASAGWYGTAARGKTGSEGRGGKFSAARADYQRGLPGSKAKVAELPSSDASSGGSPSSGGDFRSDSERRRDAAAEALEQETAKDQTKEAAVALQQKAKTHRPPADRTAPVWWDYSSDEMKEYLDDPKKMEAFTSYVNGVGEKWDEIDASREHNRFTTMLGRGTSIAYGPEHANTWQNAPYKFPNETHDGYRPSPEPGAVESAMARIDDEDASLKFDKPLSQLGERELREEFDTSKRVAQAMKTAGVSGDDAVEAFSGQFANPGASYVSRFAEGKGAQQHLENIHRMRHLRAKTGWGGTAGGSAAGQARGGGGGGWTGTPGQPAQPTGGGGGRLEPVSDDEATKKMDARLLKEAQANYSNAADTAMEEFQTNYDPQAQEQIEEFKADLNFAGSIDEINTKFEKLPEHIQNAILGAQTGARR